METPGTHFFEQRKDQVARDSHGFRWDCARISVIMKSWWVKHRLSAILALYAPRKPKPGRSCPNRWCFFSGLSFLGFGSEDPASLCFQHGRDIDGSRNYTFEPQIGLEPKKPRRPVCQSSLNLLWIGTWTLVPVGRWETTWSLHDPLKMGQ